MNKEAKIGWLGALALALGINIGGGLWTTPIIAASIGGPITAVIALMGLLPVVLAAPSFIALAKTLPTSAGSYYYPTRLMLPEYKGLGHFITWVIIWSQIAMGGFAILRTVLAAGAAYLHAFFPMVPTDMFLLAMLGLTFLISWFGLEAVGWSEIVMSGMLAVSLGVILGGGAFNIDPSNFTPIAPEGMSVTLSTYALLFSTVVGAFGIIELGGEIEDAGKNVGRALLVSAFTTLVIASLIVLVSVGTIPYPDLQNRTLQYVTAQSLPGYMVTISSIGAIVAGLSTAIGLVPGVARWISAAAEDGILPEKVTEENKHGEPKYVILFLVILSVSSVILNMPISAVVSASALTGLGIIVPVCLTGFRLPSKHPELLQHKSIKESWYLSPRIIRWSALGAVIVLMTMIVTRAMNSPQGVFWYLVFLVTGALIYAVSMFTGELAHTSNVDENLRGSTTSTFQDD